MLVFLHRGSDSDATWAVCDPSSQRWHCYYCQLMFMWFSCTETYSWSAHTSSSFVIDWCWDVLEFQYCFWLFTDVDYFLCAKCSHHFRLMFMWFSCIETYRWSVCTSSSFVIDWCWHFFYGKCSRISIVFLIIYWCWLFFMCKMFLSFSTDVYVIFLYWNISMECTHFIFICHLLMLTYFCVENVPQFQYCFWLFIHVDYFSCAKCSYHVLIIFQNFNIAFDYLLMLTIFHVPKFL